jgi:hypothetical protein
MMEGGWSMKALSYVMMLMLVLPSGAHAQTAHMVDGTKAVGFAVEPVPFGPGETITYRAKWGVFGTVGGGSLEVEGIDTVRGQPSYRLAFRMRGKVTFWSTDDVQRSWLDVDGLYAHRFHQTINSSTYQRNRTLDFLRDEMRWVREGKPEENGELATDIPLDDVSFLYFVRTLPLEVGETYTLPRYYKDEGNPVTLEVLRREKVKVPAGEFDAIVVRPIIRTEGLFGEGGEAEVWFTDDENRLLVKLQAKMGAGPFGGTLRMEMQEYSPGTRLVGAPSQEPLRANR